MVSASQLRNIASSTIFTYVAQYILLLVQDGYGKDRIVQLLGVA